MAMLFFIFFTKKELPVGSSHKVIKHTEVCNTITSKKATLEKINSPEWLLKHVLIRFINDDRNRSFEGIYLWH